MVLKSVLLEFVDIGKSVIIIFDKDEILDVW